MHHSEYAGKWRTYIAQRQHADTQGQEHMKTPDQVSIMMGKEKKKVQA